MKEFASRFVDSFVGVRSKIISLCLQQVGRQATAAIAIVESQGSTHGRHRNAHLNGRGDHSAPGCLCFLDGVLEERVDEQVLQLRIFVKRFLYLAEEGRTNNTTAAPHQGDAAIVQVPVMVLGGRSHKLITLGVTDNLRGIQGLAQVV